jgi:uncharacterized protein (TIGR03382 family)
MTNNKLLMFAVAGIFVPAVYEGAAGAESQGSQVTVMVPAPVKDLAPVTGKAPNQRLKRTDEEQPGNEMCSFALFKDGKSGLYFCATTELNIGGTATRAPNNVQLSMTRFALTQDAGTGVVSAVPDLMSAAFVTKNKGNERRNANNSTAMTVNDGTVICAKYNFNQNNDTVRYIQCFNQAGDVVLPQTKAYAKNNDDCSMHQDGEPGSVVSFDKATATTKIVEWGGCNGNNQDDGWAWVTSVKCDSAEAPTECTFANVFDVSLAAREERSRGKCTVSAADPSYAVCSWTEGNNQPQRDGCWLGAIDLSSDAKGSKQQQTILWKKQIGGRLDLGGIRTYAQRAIHERVLAMNTTTGTLEPTDTIMYRWGDASGNNNGNAKGGTYRTQKLAVIKTSRTGMTYVAKPVDMANELLGTGGTHLGVASVVFGTTDHLMPGLILMNGSHTGGVTGASIRAVGFATAANKFVKLGASEIAPHDRHLYSNYLGNNPGNQGRNHSQLSMVANPFAGIAGNTDAYVLLSATSGKTMTDGMNAAIKLSAFMTVTGIAQLSGAGAGAGAGTGGGDGTGGGNGTGGSSNNSSDDNTSDPGTTLGGCSTTGGSSGLASFALIGLVAVVLRRRRG